MLLAAARALAAVVPATELAPDHIIPKVLDFTVAPAIAHAVATAAIATGAAKVGADPEWVAERTRQFINEGRLPVPPATADASASYATQSVDLHRRFQGVLEIKSKVPITDEHILGLFYLPPGAVEPTERIAEHPDGCTTTHQAQPGRDRLRWLRSTRARQHRCPRGDAGDGREVGALSHLCRCGGISDLPLHAGPPTRSSPSSSVSNPPLAA